MSSSSFKFLNVQQVSRSDSPSVLNTRETSRRASSCPVSIVICPVRHFTPQRRDCNAIDCRKCSEDALCKSTTTACKSEEKREDRQGRPRQCWDATRTLASLRCFLLPAPSLSSMPHFPSGGLDGQIPTHSLTHSPPTTTQRRIRPSWTPALCHTRSLQFSLGCSRWRVQSRLHWLQSRSRH